MKVLTVAVPSYNVEAYLEKTLESFIISQHMDELEILIVNDGSSDGTRAIGERYAKNYPGIFSVINKENGGHGSAVNAGIEQATGKYFRIVDGDDWVEKDGLIRLIKFLKDADADLVTTDYRTVNMDTGEKTDLKFEAGAYGKDLTVSECLAMNLHFPMASVCYRTELLQKHKIRLQEKLFYVDEEYNVLPFAYTEKIYCCDWILYNYRIGNVNQSISIKNQVARIDHKVKVAGRLTDFVEHADLRPENREYCRRKVQGLITSIYLIMLIYNPDRKRAAAVTKQVRNLLREESGELFRRTKKKYRIFRIMGMLSCRKGLYEGMLYLQGKMTKKGRIKYV